MADVRKLTENLFVASQLTAADVAEIDGAGFRAILCNRPDGEEAGQPEYSQIQKQADALGLMCESQPVNGSQISDADVDSFSDELQNLPGPVLAYCRTGTRCTVLWALSQAGHRATEEILQIAAAAGYSLDALKPRIEERAALKKS
ncbi:TIGR01244 family protein [Chromatiales bacterium (ex Bugula neritina AB1)]|nr:TIGR01244 family protein [Chromatiales bacterium (ex Bugula neritina AB1)]